MVEIKKTDLIALGGVGLVTVGTLLRAFGGGGGQTQSVTIPPINVTNDVLSIKQLFITRPTATASDPHIMLKALTPGIPGQPGTGRSTISAVDDLNRFLCSIEMGGAAMRLYTNDGRFTTQRFVISAGTPRVYAGFTRDPSRGIATDVLLGGNDFYFFDAGQGDKLWHDGANLYLKARGNVFIQTSKGTTVL